MPTARPDGARIALVAVTGTSLALNTWRLGLNGLGNQYYAAAARSMTLSWRNFFFAAFDPGGFITVDKPPVSLWIQGLSARLFGISTWSLILPSALAGAGAVALLWVVVRRQFGPTAATIAALVLALSPVNVAVNRINLPEPFLVLWLVAAAWAVQRSLDADRWGRWLVLAGAFAGLAFNTKMLAGYIPLPALALALVVAARPVREATKRVAVLAGATLACSVPWLLAVTLWPASSRPYIGGSRDNSVLDLVFGYNGLGRVETRRHGHVHRLSGSGGVLGGAPGPFRMVSDALGGQIAWLLPLAVLALAAGLWRHRAADDRDRLAMLLLGAAWLGLCGLVFSFAGGTFHAYYVSLMVPGLAVVLGIGLTALVPLLRSSPGWLLATAGATAATVGLQWGLAERDPDFYGWARFLLVALVVGGAAGVMVGLAECRRRPVLVGLATALAGALVTPTAWAASETANPVLNATLPQAGPRHGIAGRTFGSVHSNGNPRLAAFLRARHKGETWDLVVANAQMGSGLIADDSISVMALGGFMGSDPAIGVADMAGLVEQQRVRYFQAPTKLPKHLVDTATGILWAVEHACAPVAPAPVKGIYDCAGRGPALRQAGILADALRTGRPPGRPPVSSRGRCGGLRCAPPATPGVRSSVEAASDVARRTRG